MNPPSCAECSRSLSASEAFELNGKTYCGPCAQTAAQRVKEAGQPVTVSRYVDKSICARCNTYIGDSGESVGPVRLCQPCAQLVQDWPYPQWLKLSLAALLLLLAFALVHGRKYFEAGKNLYRGEQLIEQGKNAEALPCLKAALKVAPNSDKGALLTAKAALLTGDVQTASQALEGHDGGHFEDADKPEFREVDELWKHATTAIVDLQKAEKLEEADGNEAQSANLAHSAAAIYPQLPHIDVLVYRYDAGVAFLNKDYDTFLNLANKSWQAMPVSGTAAMLASALACKYAVTGDVAYRQNSEEMLAKAKELAQGDKEVLDSLAEFQERNQYRLNTRQIITKAQFDRKFRNAKNVGETR